MAELPEILLRSPVVAPALEAVSRLGLPDWYVGAGAVAQTVWNDAHGFDPRHGLKDLDVVYFDPSDLSADGEHRVEDRLADDLRHLGIELDVTNEARVHTWYEHRFGVPLAPYESSAAAIATWPSIAGSIGVRIADDTDSTDDMDAAQDTDGTHGMGGGRRRHGVYRCDGLVVCAPFGLDDLFGLIVRPNTVLVTEPVYTAKAARWAATWPRLTVVPWPEAAADPASEEPADADLGLGTAAASGDAGLQA